MRILWLKTELLHPVDKGGKIRTYEMLKCLKQKNHVTYISLDDRMGSADADLLATEYCDELITVHHSSAPKYSRAFYRQVAANVLSPLPYAIEKYRSARMKQVLVERLASGSYDVFVSDFLAPSVNVPEQQDCPSVLFQHNVEAVIWRRHYEVADGLLKKLYMFMQWLKMRNFEKRECGRYDVVVAVSADDRDILREQYGVRQAADVPTGVDTEYFSNSGRIARRPNSLVFTGSMDWLPNEDAVIFFVTQVLPRIRENVEDVAFTIVGRNPSERVRELSIKDSCVRVTGPVSDVRPFLEEAMAFVVPVRIGGGTRLKIFEAMAMGIPVVSTTIGVEGLPIRNGTDLLVSDTPEAFAASVTRLLADEEYAAQLASRGVATVKSRFSWESAAEAFSSACRLAVASQLKGGVQPASASPKGLP